MIHVIPLNDDDDHEESEFCHCNPVIKEGVCIHNAFDGREVYEEARERIESPDTNN